MEIDANYLARHLKRIFIKGDSTTGIQDVVLGQSFESTAMSQDGKVMISAPPLALAEMTLPRAIGIDLKILIEVLTTVYKEHRIDIRLEPDASGVEHLVLDGGELGRAHLVAMDPKAVVSLDPEVFAKEFSRIKDKEGVPIRPVAWDKEFNELFDGEVSIGPSMVQDVPKVADILRAKLATLTIEKDGAVLEVFGESVHTGAPGLHRTELPFLHLRNKATYKMTLDAKVLASLLKTLRPAQSQTNIHLTAGYPIGFSTEDGYRYLLTTKESTRKVRG